MTDQSRQLLALSAQIVAAHASNHNMDINALTSIIRNVYNTLADLESVVGDHQREAGQLIHHVHHEHREHIDTILKSNHDDTAHVHPVHGQTVFSDHLICMEDGLSMKMLKRHLLTVHGMTPEEYRAKWDLPESYPMVAADYAKLRSSLAVQSGLGLKPDDRTRKGRKARTG